MKATVRDDLLLATCCVVFNGAVWWIARLLVIAYAGGAPDGFLRIGLLSSVGAGIALIAFRRRERRQAAKNRSWLEARIRRERADAPGPTTLHGGGDA